MTKPQVTYMSRPGTTPTAETSTLAAVYKFVLGCHAKRNAASVTSTNGGDAMKKGSMNDDRARISIPEAD